MSLQDIQASYTDGSATVDDPKSFTQQVLASDEQSLYTLQMTHRLLRDNAIKEK